MVWESLSPIYGSFVCLSHPAIGLFSFFIKSDVFLDILCHLDSMYIFMEIKHLSHIYDLLRVLGKVNLPLLVGYVEKPFFSYIGIKYETLISLC